MTGVQTCALPICFPVTIYELNEASAMKARAEAWQTANYAGPEAEARTSSARSVVDLNERHGHEINAAIRFIDEQIKTEGTKRVLHMNDAALNDARQALVDLEAKHSQLGLNRAGVESKFYSESALGIVTGKQIGRAHV